MQIDLDEYSDYVPDKYGENDDILTGFVKGMGGIAILLLGSSFLAIFLITRRKSKEKQ